MSRQLEKVGNLLTEKDREILRAYVMQFDYNELKTAAYCRTSENTVTRLAIDPEGMHYIASLEKEKLMRRYNPYRSINWLIDMASFNPADVVKPGMTLEEWELLPSAIQMCVKKMEWKSREIISPDGNLIVETLHKVEFYDRLKAIEMLIEQGGGVDEETQRHFRDAIRAREPESNQKSVTYVIKRPGIS